MDWITEHWRVTDRGKPQPDGDGLFRRYRIRRRSSEKHEWRQARSLSHMELVEFLEEICPALTGADG